MKRLGLGATKVSIVATALLSFAPFAFAPLVLFAGGCSASSDESWESRGAALGQGVRPAMEDGHAPVSVLVYLKGAADLAPRAELASASKEARITSVHARLVAHAKRAQGPLLGWLQRQGVSYRRFHIVNAVLVNDASPGLVRHLAARPDVERLVLDRPVALKRVQSPGSESLSPEAIGSNITATGAVRVWNELHVKGAGVVVAGQDTGVDWTHPALQSHYRGWDGATADHRYSWHDAIHSGSGNRCGYDLAAPCDDDQHGTHTMGTIVGDDGAGNQIGMAPDAKWIACRNMDAGVGKPSTYIECSQWFLAPYPQGGDPETQGDPSKAPDVINNSWGCPSSEGCEGAEIVPVLRSLKAAGIVFVASAGNDGPGCKSIRDQPATDGPDALVVGAYNHGNGAIASFSSRGPSTLDGGLGPEVVAPGVSIRSAVPGGRYSGSFSGTSMAGPHVVGEVALLLSAVPALRGQVDKITSIVTGTAAPKTSTETCGGVSGSSVPNNTFGYGVIDAYKAVGSQLGR
ncbi:S8 family serine peptidase [Pendulispora albinea]|uniref:S8 family serine peptidase n=1 Tax=Pendulispora albinea TaxID=2741071 RepID=A0ABZ2M3S8_9BACT